jgi:hypothetical protein
VERTAERFLACLGYKQRLGSIATSSASAASCSSKCRLPLARDIRDDGVLDADPAAPL